MIFFEWNNLFCGINDSKLNKNKNWCKSPMSNTFKSLIHNFKKSINFLLVVFLFLPLLASCSTQKIVVHDVEEKEANEIIVFLSSRGIVADKITAESAGAGGNKIPMYNITVTDNNWVNAMRHLDREGLPRKKGTSLLKLFGTAGLVPSEQEEKIRFRAGKEEELANTIRKIDGVIDADVQLSLPDDVALTPGMVKETSTASVYVKHQGVLEDQNSHLVTKIKRWVASSIPGLEFENVTVIADRARSSYDIEEGGVEELMKEKDKEYVKTWGVILAKESVSHFQFIFFTFSGILLLLCLVVGWVVWKISPLMEKFGGMPAFFTTLPFRLDESGNPITESEEEKNQEKDASEDDEEKDEEEEEEDDDDDDDDEEEK
jgi:type III secretion protein J